MSLRLCAAKVNALAVLAALAAIPVLAQEPRSAPERSATADPRAAAPDQTAGTLVQTLPQARHALQIMHNSKIGVFDAVQAAENRTNGKAISVLPLLHGRDLAFNVYCITPNDRLVSVIVDSRGIVRESSFASRIDYTGQGQYGLAGSEEPAEPMPEPQRGVRPTPQPEPKRPQERSEGAADPVHVIVQDEPMQDEPQQPMPPAQPPVRPGERRVTVRREQPDEVNTGAGEIEVEHELPFVRASRLMHAKVLNTGGNGIGNLENLAIDTHRGQVVYGVLGTGGFLRMGQKKFAVPYQALEIRSGDRVVVNVDKQALKRSAGFRGNAWPATADASFLRGRDVGAGEYAQAGAEENTGNVATFNAKGSDLIGRTVLNMQGDKLGTIRDLAVDRRTGRIRYAIIASGGFLRIGNRLLPVPWSAMDTRGNDAVRLDIQKARLETAPTFSNTDWSALTNPDFEARINAFYGQKLGLEPRPLPPQGQPRPMPPPNAPPPQPEIER